MIRSTRWITAALVIMTASAQAHAQAYPNKPVRLIIPTTPGGGLDVLGRIIAAKLGETWGQPVLAENRPGANFVIGVDVAAKSPPDGYTLLITASPAITINPLVIANLPHDPLRDLVPINIIASSPFVLAVHQSVPASNATELLAHLRANPGKLNLASHSSSTRLASELFKALAKVDYTDVSYKGGGQSAASVTAGEVEMSFLDMGSAIAPLASGRVRAMAVTTSARYRLRPEIPTLQEAGVPGYASVGWTGIYAPAKTADDLVARISADLTRIINQPDVTPRFEAAGNEVIGTDPKRAMDILREDADKWARLVKERNIKF